MDVAIRVHYTVRRRNETVLDKYPELGIITRNRYGADILNADNVMFLDWDAKPARLDFRGWQGFLRLVSSLFKNSASQKEKRVRQAKAALEVDIRGKVAELNLGLRLYETCNGLRGIVTSSRFDPTEPLTTELMTYMGADPMYIRLCNIQNTFRARLTPKFWRTGLNERPHAKPAVTPEEIADMQRWLERYNAHCQPYATAQLIDTLGSSSNDELIQQTIELHDDRCKVLSNLKLA